MQEAESAAAHSDVATQQLQGEYVSGEIVEVSQSSVAFVSGTTVSLRQTLVNRLEAERAVLSQSCAVFSRAQQIELQKSAVGLMVGQSVSAEDSRVVFLFAPRVTGPVRATFTLPAAFALGVGIVLARAVVRSVGRHFAPDNA